MRFLLIGVGVAALALSTPVLAFGPGGGHGGGGNGGGPPGGGGGHGGGPPGGGGGIGHGGGHGNGGGGPQMERDGPPPQMQRAPQQQAERSHGPAPHQQRGPERQARAEHQRGPDRRQAQVSRHPGPDRAQQRQSMRQNEQHGQGPAHFNRQAARGRDWHGSAAVGGALAGAAAYTGADGRDVGRRVDGCPPGLAAKNNGCLPPGQARQLLNQRVSPALSASLLPVAYRSWYPDNSDYYYRTQDNLIYRVARSSGLVDGYAPLFGYGADYYPDYYSAGERYPTDYVSFYNVPLPYQRYYADEGNDLYRYGDGGIYQVNRSNGLVDSLVALLAGDLSMGQPLPEGYDVYNVPYQYRDRYADSADEWYRYNDGYIYQVDPKTRLITAVIEALV